MTAEEFKQRYGKLKVLECISERHPVIAMPTKDKNRCLMIKFKYGNLSASEELEFHEAIKKLIYRVMHSNKIMMNWEDIYQEIWKKIIQCKHTWKEYNGTMVSTWITIVANSVINTLREGVGKRNAHVILYDDMMESCSEGTSESSDQIGCDVLSYSIDSVAMEDNDIRKLMWEEQYGEFIKALDFSEKYVMDVAMLHYGSLMKSENERILYNDIREKTGYDSSTFAMIVYNMRKKYCRMFGYRMEDCNYTDADGKEYLF